MLPKLRLRGQQPQHPNPLLPVTGTLPSAAKAQTIGNSNHQDDDSDESKNVKIGNKEKDKATSNKCGRRRLWMILRMTFIFVGTFLFLHMTMECLDYVQDMYRYYQNERLRQNNKDMYQYKPRYDIQIQVIPKKVWPIPTRKWFRSHNGRIVRQAKNAITELGDDIRDLLLQGQGRLHLTPWEQPDENQDQNQNQDDALVFRKRLAARALWLRGDHINDPKWPLSTLPQMIPGTKALVISGGDKQLEYLKTLVYTVRVIHQSTMPIRIVYRDDLDLTEPSKKEIRNQQQTTAENDNNDDSIQFINLSHYFDLDAVDLKGWNLKAFGMLVVAEAELAMLDADVLLLRPPEDLFLPQGYQRTGAFFYHDRIKPQFCWNINVFWQWLVGAGDAAGGGHLDQRRRKLQQRWSDTVEKLFVPGTTKSSSYSEHVQEAGVFVVDKTRRARGIWAACLIFGRQDIRKYIQTDHMYGDKEVYWNAMEVVTTENDEEEQYEFSRYYPGVIGGTVTNFGRRTTHLPLDAPNEQVQSVLTESIATDGALCGRLLHFDDAGVPLWSNGGYMLKEDDWHSSASISQSALNPVWFVDGGDGQTESFPNPWGPFWRNILQWYSTLKGENQVWALHKSMGVECLSANSRQVRAVPNEMASAARKAVHHYFDEQK